MDNGKENANQLLNLTKSYEQELIRYDVSKEKEQRLFSRILGDRLKYVPTMYHDEIYWFATSEGKYFSRIIFDLAINFLEHNQAYIKDILNSNMLENLSYARLKLDFLAEQITQEFTSGYQDARIRIELRDAPVYLKLYEEIVNSILVPFLRILEIISPKKKNYGNLKVRNKMDVIRSTSELAPFIRNCYPTVRNAIGHGGVSFKYPYVIFRDDNGNEERFSEIEFSKIVISLIDDLYGIMLALDLYFMINVFPRQVDQLHTLPLSLKKRMIFHILGGLDYKILNIESAPNLEENKQLNVMCYVSYNTYERTLGTTLRILDLVSIYFPKYENLYVGIRGNEILPGFVRINIKNFLKWKCGDISFDVFFREVHADILLWMPPKSDIFNRYKRIISHSIKFMKNSSIPMAIEEYNHRVDPYYDMYYLCNLEDKSIEQAKRLKADVIILPQPIQTNDLIGIIISATKQVRKKKTYRNKMISTKYGRKKADYVWLEIYSDMIRFNNNRHQYIGDKKLARSEFFSGIKGLDWVVVKNDFEQSNKNLRIQIFSVFSQPTST